MLVNKEGFFDLTYCTNIHSGETWPEVYAELNKFVLPLKALLSPQRPFAIGLRLSHFAASTLLHSDNLNNFKQWLADQQLYIMTINGFPYGKFHNKRVKEKAYAPDWTTNARRDYSLNLVKILDALTPTNGESGFSTSPLSYKPWLNIKTLDKTFFHSSIKLAQIVEAMIPIYKTSGKLLHVDIEPEPDCLIETTHELVQYYLNWLIPVGAKYLSDQLKITQLKAEEHIRRHVQVCYDICHSSVEYEEPADNFKYLAKAGITIGKIQVSAALKYKVKNGKMAPDLYQFDDNRYMHQVIERSCEGHLSHFVDLPDALAQPDLTDIEELRMHFHVPVFLNQYQHLDSTQSDVTSVIELIKQNRATRHLEIETYTWEVLPAKLNLDIISSIKREYEWVLQQFET